MYKKNQHTLHYHPFTHTHLYVYTILVVVVSFVCVCVLCVCVCVLNPNKFLLVYECKGISSFLVYETMTRGMGN
jgi:hypothetical protein